MSSSEALAQPFLKVEKVVIIDERVCKKRLNWLAVNYTEQQFLQDSDGNARQSKTYYEKLMKYIRDKATSATSLVKYKYSKGRYNGRMTSVESLQTIIKNVRNFLIPNGSLDLDFENTHPTLLLNICNKHNIVCSSLFEYVNNREDILTGIVSDDNISLEEAKKKVLIIINSNTRIKTANAWTKRFISEIKKIRAELMNITEYEYLKEFASRENNEGSFVNHILCVEEDALLQLLRHYLESNGIEIFALMFDGIIVYPPASLINIEETIIEAMNYVRTHSLHKNIKIVLKPIITDLVMPSDYEPIVRKSYQDVKGEFEKNNCKVDAIFYHKNNSYCKSDFFNRYANLYYYDNLNKQCLFLSNWLADETIRTYESVGVFPNSNKEACPSDVYNLWVDWNISDVEVEEEASANNTDGLMFFLDHIRVLTCYDKLLSNFVLRWLAQMFQYTHIKTIELIFVSSEGAGKGLFLAFLRTIMGSKKVFESTDPQRDIFGQFNTQMKDSVLVIFNEANRSSFFNSNDKKKALITDDVITINDKGKSSIVINSCHRFMTFTNNPDPSTKNKRRDLFIRASDDKIGDKSYFTKGFKYASDKQVCRTIYDYLMSYPCPEPTITEFDIPNNSAYDKLLNQEQRHIVLQFLDHYTNVWRGSTTPTKSGLYKQFLDFKKEENVTYEMSKVAFSMKISFYNFKHIREAKEVVDDIRQLVWKIDTKALKEELDNL